MSHQLAQPVYDVPYLALLLVAEALLNVLIVRHVPYTEIDWVAYMQEVSTYQAGERDYIRIRGDTGPLVYPAGFLYLYSAFKKSVCGDSATATDVVEDPFGLGGSASPEVIRRAQWLFVMLYLINSAIVLALYQKILQRTRQRQIAQQSRNTTITVWSWRIAMGITCLSKRIHSIFILRLFNDAPAMTLLHLSLYLFTCCDAWMLGCVAFSLAVSVKMNVLLFAPGLLLLLLQRAQSISGTIRHLSICAGVQLVLGWPFLSTHPKSYIKKAFEFDRIFFFKWTVNWKFLPEHVFISKPWAFILLACHLGWLGILSVKWWKASMSQRGRAKTRAWLHWKKCTENNLQLTPEYIIYTMFVSNFIGITWARTLHYQFYSWYFHALPMLHWLASTYSVTSKSIPRMVCENVVAIFAVEYAFNVFPATGRSSMVLQLAHAFLLMKIFSAEIPSIAEEEASDKGE